MPVCARTRYTKNSLLTKINISRDDLEKFWNDSKILSVSPIIITCLEITYIINILHFFFLNIFMMILDFYVLQTNILLSPMERIKSENFFYQIQIFEYEF